MMVNSVSQEDCSLTVRLVQNYFKQRQSEVSKNYRYVVDSLQEITQHIFTALVSSGFEDLLSAFSGEGGYFR